MSRFEDTVDFLIEQTKEVCPNLSKKRRLDLIFIGSLAEHLESRVKFIKTLGYKDYSFEAILKSMENTIKEIEEIYEKKRKELGV